MRIGEAFIGNGANAAHINVVLGPREGPVGAAWATALANPKPGHIPFLVVLQPGVPAKPMTVFINKADLRGETHEEMTWGPAQAGIAKGIAECLLEGTLPPEAEDSWCIIAAVWVDWAANDAAEVFANNHTAARDAIVAAMRNEPALEAVREAAPNPHNPFFTPRS